MPMPRMLSGFIAMAMVLFALPGMPRAADDVIKPFAGDWVSDKGLCTTSREKRTVGTGVRIDLGTLEFENYEGEGIACTIRNARQGADSVVVTAMCRDEEAAPEERTFHVFHRAGRLVVSRQRPAEANGDAESFVRCEAAAEVPRKWLKRFCTIVDGEGTITDRETGQVVTEPCGHAGALAPNCLIVQWPSGARTLVETPDQTVAAGKRINGKAAEKPTLGWLPITGDCIRNAASLNTLCLTIGPFQRN